MRLKFITTKKFKFFYFLSFSVLIFHFLNIKIENCLLKVEQLLGTMRSKQTIVWKNKNIVRKRIYHERPSHKFWQGMMTPAMWQTLCRWRIGQQGQRPGASWKRFSLQISFSMRFFGFLDFFLDVGGGVGETKESETPRTSKGQPVSFSSKRDYQRIWNF